MNSIIKESFIAFLLVISRIALASQHPTLEQIPGNLSEDPRFHQYRHSGRLITFDRETGETYEDGKKCRQQGINVARDLTAFKTKAEDWYVNALFGWKSIENDWNDKATQESREKLGALICDVLADYSPKTQKKQLFKAFQQIAAKNKNENQVNVDKPNSNNNASEASQS